MAVDQSLAPLPAPVPFLCEYIEKSGLTVEGLFRIAGNKTKIDSIVDAFKHESKVVLEDVHDATGALKAFFRLMPEPLIPFPHYEGFVAVGEMDDEKQKILLQAMITTLPRNHVNLLRYLVLFLHRIAKRADVNMMSEGNLAIVFGPNLLRPEVEDATQTHKHTGLISKVVSSMIVYAKDIFPPEEVKPEVLELTKKHSQVEAARSQLLEERNKLLEERSKWTEERAVLVQERDTATAERNRLQADLEGMHACLAASLAAVASVQRDKENYDKERAEAAQELAALKQQVSDLKQSLTNAETQYQAEVTKGQDASKRLEAEIAQVVALTSQLATLKQEAENQHEEQKKASQVLLDQLSNKREVDEKTAVMAMEGMLSKRSSGLPHRWQKRQCTLTSSMLYWLSGDGDSSKSKAAMACVFLADVVSVEDLGSGQPAFTINTKSKAGVVGSFTFAAPTVQDRDKWISSINHNMSLLKPSAVTPRAK